MIDKKYIEINKIFILLCKLNNSLFPLITYPISITESAINNQK